MNCKLSNDEFQQQLQNIRNEGKDIYTNDLYVDSYTSLDFYCSRDHHWLAKPSNVLLYHTGCPFCANKKILVGFNDLWTTRSDIAMLLKDKEHGYLYVAGSNKSDEFECPNCHTISTKQIKHVCDRGFTCNCCGDGVSYPNKFARAFLQQVECEKIIFEWSPDWLRPYKYDNYFIYNGNQYVLEMDGRIGHGYNDSYERVRKSGLFGKELDDYKDSLAIKHNIITIRIDCAYRDTYKRDLYIKNNMINSELSQIIDLQNINWNQCNSFAINSMVVESSQLYNDGMSVGQIATAMNYCRGTIKNWLKQGEKLSLNNYTVIDSRKRGLQHRNDIRKSICIDQYTLDGKFIKHYTSFCSASQALGVSGVPFSYYKQHDKNEFIYHNFLWKIDV